MMDNMNRTALHYAALNGDLSLVTKLSEQPNVSFRIKDNNGKTALILATEAKHPGVIRLLLPFYSIEDIQAAFCSCCAANSPDVFAAYYTHEPFRNFLFNEPEKRFLWSLFVFSCENEWENSVFFLLPTLPTTQESVAQILSQELTTGIRKVIDDNILAPSDWIDPVYCELKEKKTNEILGENRNLQFSDFCYCATIKRTLEEFVITATHCNSGHPLCIKMKANYEYKSDSSKLSIERRILEKIGYHPNIVQHYAYFEDRPSYDMITDIEDVDIHEFLVENQQTSKSISFLVLEKSSCTLKDFLERNRNSLSAYQLLIICQNIANTLLFLYKEKRVVHRALELHHILMREDGSLCIADFGMAIELDDNDYWYRSDYDRLEGNFESLAPEVRYSECNRFSYYGKQPVWQLGLIFHQIMFGGSTGNTKTCFGEENLLELPFGVPIGFLQLVETMLVENADDRISLAGAVLLVNHIAGNRMANDLEMTECSASLAFYQSFGSKHLFGILESAPYFLLNCISLLDGKGRYSSPEWLCSPLFSVVSFYLPKAIEISTLAVHNGIPAAQYYTGFYYEIANGVNKDISKAIGLYTLAANSGHPGAQCALGRCYQSGTGVDKDIHKGLELYRLAAVSKIPTALSNIGTCYYNGTGVEKDVQKAIEFFIIAADFGHSAVQYNLGVCYKNGIGVKRDFDKAAELFTIAANSGFPAAQYQLGACYRDGNGVKKNLNKAVALFTLAANSEIPGAQYNLALSFHHGNGVNKNTHKAVELYRLAADSGYSAAQNNLGFFYHNGIGVNKNIHKAVELYRLSADSGYPAAQYNLGICYHYGTGVNQNRQKAVELFTIAANSGHSGGQNYLGFYYQNGIILDQDIHKAIELYTIAADSGWSASQYNLGICYQDGNGVNKDIHKAVELFTLAADSGHAAAQNHLGVYYQRGMGVNKDIHKAFELFTLAADSGHVEAQNNLGFAYANGYGVSENMQKAVELYKLSANSGFRNAQYSLGVCYQNGIGVDKDICKAVELYRLAADSGYPNAQNTLGICYKNGIGVNKDIHKAVELFALAADSGYPAAQNNLGKCYQNGNGVNKDIHKAIELFTLANS